MSAIIEHLIRRPFLAEVAHLAHRPHLAGRVNHQSLRIAVLLLVIVVLNFTDLAYTLFANSIDLLREQNPIAAGFLEVDHGPVLVYYKLLMLLAGTFMLWKLRRHRCTILGCWVLVIAYAMLGVVWWVWAREVNTMFEMCSHNGMGLAHLHL